jgi:phenylalanyl-tRNA synthetase beta chain
MKISYQWLKEFVEIGLEPRELAARLTMAGLAVDAIEPHGNDSILELDLTSNRPDCLSHLGVAREVAALTGGVALRPTDRLVDASLPADAETSIEILDPELCPRYTARLIRGVKIGPSPAWLARRLEALGQRSINNVADITNYVLLEQGQPLHAFDFNRLGGHRIIVRRARAGEKLRTLDGIERALTPEMLVIADTDQAVALAGIMGGEESEISGGTTDVLLESAYFSPASIRQTARSLGMATEASYRFERGTDREAAAAACDRAAALIAEVAGGRVLAGIIDVYPVRFEPKTVELRLSRYEKLIGLPLDREAAERIFESLGFVVEESAAPEIVRVSVPSWRADIGIEEDLIEEVARISGYDLIEDTLPGGTGAGEYLKGESGRRAARQTLIGMGYHEAINFSFVNAEAEEAVSLVPAEERLTLTNPIDETQSQMRTTLLSGLLASVSHNFNHGRRNVRLFEIGKCFERGGEERPREVERLGLVATGALNDSDWRAPLEKIDFFDLKGPVEAIGESLGLAEFIFTPTSAVRYLHPGRAAVISLGGMDVGLLGQLHPRVAAGYKFKQPVYLAELDFGRLLAAEAAEVRYFPLPKFPTVIRDLSILLPTRIMFGEIERAIIGLAIPELVGVRLFDLYQGKELPEGQRSLALSLRYRAADRTLTEPEIAASHARVLDLLRREFGAELRQ